MADATSRNLEKIARVVTKEMLERAIKDTERVDDVVVDDFSVDWAGKLGDNAATFVLRVEVRAKLDGVQQERSFIVKTSQDNAAIAKTMHKAGLFKKEIGAYEKLIPAFAQVQKGAGIDPVILPSVPKFYHGMEDGEEEPGVVMVGDLQPEGFRMVPKADGADLEHAKLVVKELATWHALSLALKNRDAAGLKSKFDFAFKEAQFGSAFEMFQDKPFQDCVERMVRLAQESSLSQEVKTRAKKLLELNALGEVRKAIQPEEPFAVITHGDCWCNNMLFRYDVVDSKETPVAATLLDLQIVRYSLPTTDLVYFFMTSTSRELRKAHLRDLLKLYHATFTSVLSHVKFECPEFTLEVVEGLFKKALPLGVVFGSVMLPFRTAKKEDFAEYERVRSTTGSEEEYMAKVAELKKMREKQGLNEAAKNSILGLIEDCIDWELI